MIMAIKLGSVGLLPEQPVRAVAAPGCATLPADPSILQPPTRRKRGRNKRLILFDEARDGPRDEWGVALDDDPGQVAASRLAFDRVSEDADPAEIEEDQLRRAALTFVFGRLPYKYRTILTHRFGLNGSDRLTLGEIGRRLHVTGERVREIEAAALRKLQHLVPAKLRAMKMRSIWASLTKRGRA